MCGIYFSSNDNAGQSVLAGLKRLEYRGYDSWGVVVLKDGQLEVEKHTGKIGGVEKVDLPQASLALGHTRWATHGGVTEVNAHPHLASDGSFALVQNGVVDNYQELKQILIDEGYTFVSQTDTEVIVHLVEHEWQQRTGGTSRLELSDFVAATAQLHGRSTVGVLTTDGRLFAFRFGSPLLVGRDDQHRVFLSSDVVSLSVDATEFFAVSNGQVIVWEGDEPKVCTLEDTHLQPLTWQPIDVKSLQLDKEGYPHFMLKEIHEQGQVLHRVLAGDSAQFEQLVTTLKAARRIYTIGAGSASLAAGQTAFHLRQAGLLATELKSYEARSFKALFTKGDVAIAFSQSGETADTNEVIEWMQAAGVTIISIVNMNGSTLTAMSDLPFMLGVGPEVGVGSTKAFMGQMVWGQVIGLLVSGKKIDELSNEIRQFEHNLSMWLSDDVAQTKLRKLAEDLLDHRQMFVLGRGQLYYPALEYALKMKEISYIHAEGFSGGELKHGVIALIEKGTPVVSLITDDTERADMLSATAEVRARGAHTIGVATANNELFDTWLPIPVGTVFEPLAAVVTSQLLTYHMAIEKGLDPDKPRNLAKSVTVK